MCKILTTMERIVTTERQNIGALFDRIASSYDSLNHILSLNIDKRWRRRAIKELKPAARLLDVAIGTADLTLEALQQKKAEQVTGIDLSEEMMKIGEKKVAEKGFDGKVTFDTGSALEMPYPSGSFDTLTCAFGVRNFSDLEKGLSEFHRVLKKGGELCILEFSYPDNRLIAWGYDIYFSHILPLIGRMFSKDKTAYTYLNKSVKSFIWGKDMVEKINDAGFTHATFTPLTLGIATIYRAVNG